MPDFGCWVCGAEVVVRPAYKNGTTNGIHTNGTNGVANGVANGEHKEAAEATPVANGKSKEVTLRFCEEHLKLWNQSYEKARIHQTGIFDFITKLKLEAQNSGKTS